MSNVYEQATHTLESYDKNLYLGRLAWYSISEGLNLTWMDFTSKVTTEFSGVFDVPVFEGPSKKPLFPKLANVFRRACTSAGNKKIPSDQPDIFYNYLVRAAGADSDHIWQTIVRESLDKEGHTLSYAEVVRITFTRSTEKIRFNNVEEDHEDENVNEIVNQIVQYYQNNKDILTPYTIREWLRSFMEVSLKATRVRPSGGVYFVSEEFGDAVEALDRCFNGFGFDASFHLLPLVDDSKQRQMLRTAFEAESIGEVDELIGELAELLSSGKKVSSSKFADYKVKYDHLMSKTRDYSELLEDTLFSTNDRLEILNSMLIKALGSVKV